MSEQEYREYQAQIDDIEDTVVYRGKRIVAKSLCQRFGAGDYIELVPCNGCDQCE